MPRHIQTLPEHNYKLVVEGGSTLYYISESAALSARHYYNEVRGVKAWIMVKLSDGSYVPLETR